MLSQLTFAWVLALFLVFAEASVLVPYREPSALGPRVETTYGSPDVARYIHRRLYEIGLQKREERTYTNSTSLDKSFNGVTIYTYSKNPSTEISGNRVNQTISANAGISIVCSTCYTKGEATARLTFDPDSFNATELLDSVEDEAKEVVHEIGEWLKDTVEDLIELDFDIPAPNISFNMDFQGLPSAVLEFQFDGVELYVELEITLTAGATYQLSLYKSEGPLGFDLGSDILDLSFGLVFQIDLILSVEADIVITSGFHLKLDDGILMRIAIFANETSDLNFNGGQFEFLPVTVETSGAVLHATLQLSLHAGINLDSSFHNASAGVETLVYANVGDLVTNITPNHDDAECEFNVVQEYTFAVGAGAGATAAFGSHIWGPTPATEVPIYYTTLADTCASRIASSTTSPTPTLAARLAQYDDDDDLSSTSTQIEQTYAAVLCLSPGLKNCPASLQKLTQFVSTQTLVTTVPIGSDVSWPVTTTAQVLSTVAFGTNVRSMVTTTGKPQPYNSKKEDKNGDHTGLIVGLTVGLGVPFILAVIAGIWFYCRKSKKTKFGPVPQEFVQGEPMLGEPAPYMPAMSEPALREPVPRKPVPQTPMSRKPVARESVPRKPVPSMSGQSLGVAKQGNYSVVPLDDRE